MSNIELADFETFTIPPLPCDPPDPYPTAPGVYWRRGPYHYWLPLAGWAWRLRRWLGMPGQYLRRD